MHVVWVTHWLSWWKLMQNTWESVCISTISTRNCWPNRWTRLSWNAWVLSASIWIHPAWLCCGNWSLNPFSLLAFTINLRFHSTSCSHIAGLSASRAENIIKYRTENGPFKSREELLKVKSIGPVTFLQCAGFVRIDPLTANIPRGSKMYCVLDSTWVHPESYDVAKKIIKNLGCTLSEIGTAAFIAKITNYLAENEPNMEKLSREYRVPAERVNEFIFLAYSTPFISHLIDLLVAKYFGGAWPWTQQRLSRRHQCEAIVQERRSKNGRFETRNDDYWRHFEYNTVWMLRWYWCREKWTNPCQ